jgi:shikimate dehydrogenase
VTLTNVLCVIGKPVSHSLSPYLHSFGAHLIGKKVLSFKCELATELLPSFVDFVRRKKEFTGFNVTMPFKEEITRLLDSLSYDAQKIGCVNTVAKNRHGLVGYNTDWLAFRDSVRAREKWFESTLIFGAGGAAAAAIYAIQEAKISDEVYLFNRSVERFERLSKSFNFIKRWSAEKKIELLVNATPVEPPIDQSVFKNVKLVVDFDYSRKSNQLAERCSELGIHYIDGLELLARQGVEALGFFFGEKPKLDEVLQYLRRICECREKASHTAQ